MRISDWSSDVCSSDLADEKDLAALFADLPQRKSVSEWLDFLRTHVRIFADVSPLQMREFMLDSTVGFYRQGEVVFEKGDTGSSLFAIDRKSTRLNSSH